MHVFVVLIKFGRVSFRSKSSETLFVNIYSQRLVAGDNYIDSQVEFVTIDEKWICDIPGNNTKFVDIEIVYVIYDVDTTSST